MGKPVLRHLSIIVATLTLTACGDIGCARGGATIPGGYPPTEAIQNAVQVRITDTGFETASADFCALFGGFLTEVVVPRSTTSAGGVTLDLCESRPGGGGVCTVRIDCLSGSFSSRDPNWIDVRGSFRVRSYVGGVRAALPLRIGSTATCGFDVDTLPGAPFEVTGSVSIAEIPQDIRRGFSHLLPGTIEVNGIEAADFGVSGSALCSLAPRAFLGTVTRLLSDQVRGIAQQTIDELQCEQSATGCPFGTYTSSCDTYCHFAPDPTCGCGPSTGEPTCPGPTDCVPRLVGPELRGDLGDMFMAGASDGAFGEFITAANGRGAALNNGMSVFFLAGIRSTDESFTVSPGHNVCVPERARPPLPIVPAADVLQGNVIPGTAISPDFGIAFSEEAWRNFLYGLYDSGALCIDVDGTQAPTLRTGLLSVVGSSLDALIRPEDEASIRLGLRPQLVPEIEIGDGTAASPRLALTIDRAQIEGEVFASERYLRVFTYGADISVPIELEPTGDGYALRAGDATVSDTFLGNDELLGADTSGLLTLLDIAAPLVLAPVLDQLPEIHLPRFLSLSVAPIDGGIVSVEGGGSEFIAVYGRFVPTTLPSTSPAETELAATLARPVDPRAAELATLAEAATPELEVQFTSPTNGDVEYSHRIDGTSWSVWSTATDLRIATRLLLLQGRHIIEARARRAGEPGSEDPTPASVEVLVDLRAPTLSVRATDGGFAVDARDIVTPAAALKHRIDSATAWSAGPPDGEYGIGHVVEVMDEAGNIARAGEALMPALAAQPVRATAGCNVGARRAGGSFAWLVLALVGVLWRRRG